MVPCILRSRCATTSLLPTECVSTRPLYASERATLRYSSSMIDRFSKKAGEKFRDITKKMLELFQTYDCPGNIRELQNGNRQTAIQDLTYGRELRELFSQSSIVYLWKSARSIEGSTS